MKEGTGRLKLRAYVRFLYLFLLLFLRWEIMRRFGRCQWHHAISIRPMIRCRFHLNYLPNSLIQVSCLSSANDNRENHLRNLYIHKMPNDAPIVFKLRVYIVVLLVISVLNCSVGGVGSGQLPAAHFRTTSADLRPRSIHPHQTVLRPSILRLHIWISLRAASIAIGRLLLFDEDRPARLPLETRLSRQSTTGRLPAAFQSIRPAIPIGVQTANQSTNIPSGVEEVLHLRLGQQERLSIQIGRPMRQRISSLPATGRSAHPHGYDPVLAEIIETLCHTVTGRVKATAAAVRRSF